MRIICLVHPLRSALPALRVSFSQCYDLDRKGRRVREHTRYIFNELHHSHKKRKDSLETSDILLKLLLEIEISGVAV